MIVLPGTRKRSDPPNVRYPRVDQWELDKQANRPTGSPLLDTHPGEFSAYHFVGNVGVMMMLTWVGTALWFMAGPAIAKDILSGKPTDRGN